MARERLPRRVYPILAAVLQYRHEDTLNARTTQGTPYWAIPHSFVEATPDANPCVEPINFFQTGSLLRANWTPDGLLRIETDAPSHGGGQQLSRAA